MGQHKQRLRKFFSEHPACCFCGGTTPATTQDHLPPRGIFFERKWPEGYVFPPCWTCNNGSSGDDAIVSFCSRTSPGPGRELTESQTAEWKTQLRAFDERYPGEAKKALLTANQKRATLKANGISKPDGIAYGEMPMLQFTPLMREAIRRFSRKLMLALHYKHSGRIVPTDAWRSTSHWTNFHRAIQEIPQEIIDLAPQNVSLNRGNVSLSDQFDYKFGVSEDGSVGTYLVSLRRAFSVLGIVCFDAEAMRDIDPDNIDHFSPREKVASTHDAS